MKVQLDLIMFLFLDHIIQLILCWCIIIAAFFFRLFLFLKIVVFFNYFHWNNLLFSDNVNAYRKSYPYSPYYALPLRERLECSSVISRSQPTFWRRNNQQSQVEKWFMKFKSGDTNLTDEKGRGRPSNFDDQTLLAAVEEDKSLTTRIYRRLQWGHSTIVARLKKLGNVLILARWVPHELSDYNKAEGVQIFTDLL